jgi:hypothetical protein
MVTPDDIHSLGKTTTNRIMVDGGDYLVVWEYIIIFTASTTHADCYIGIIMGSESMRHKEMAMGHSTKDIMICFTALCCSAVR